jgi:predicted GH43/DUF377 family glycosyl hydrolase
VLATSALIEDDGTWVLYFRTWESGGTLARSSMGRATAPDPDGPWTPDPERVLQPGPQGSWDDVQAAPGSVLKTDDGYVMFYAGNKKAVGMATSTDGITWTKYNDPTTSGPEFGASDPVFGVSKGAPTWDDVEVYQPRVVQSPEGFVMLYTATGSAPGMGRAAHGMAISEDGIHWTRLPENPVLLRDTVRGGQNLWFSNLLYANDTYYLYFELAKDAQNASTTVYLATHEGALVP